MTALLTGCSSTSFVYNNADWLVLGKIDDYFPLSGLQEKQLEADIDSILQWHRQQELTDYSDLLNQFTQQYADGLTGEELDLYYNKVDDARVRVAQTIIPPASQFLSTVSIKQIDHYDRIFVEKNARRVKKLETPPKDYADQKFAEFTKNLKKWFGGFDKKQMAQLRIISDARPDNRQYWFERRQRRHQEFSDLLRSQPSKEKIEQYLQERFVILTKFDTEEDDISRQMRLYWLDTLLSIDKIIIPKQRKHFIRRVSNYSSDFLALSKKSTTTNISFNEK